MNKYGFSFSVRVDCSNPGQFFACCGLLELAHRLWPIALGHFSDEHFEISDVPEGATALTLINQLTKAGLRSALTPEEKAELDTLEVQRDQAKRDGRRLPQEVESRLQELGTLLRSGPITIGAPFELYLNWWQGDRDDVPKPWAGSMQVHRIATAALAECQNAFSRSDPFDYACILRPADDNEEEDEDMKADEGKAEPFYFDSTRGANAHPLDQGFSANKLSVLRDGPPSRSGRIKRRWVKMESAAYPAVELLALIGLQRFRPRPSTQPRVFVYRTWAVPLSPMVAAAVVSGALPDIEGEAYRFENAFRTDQRKHKGFLPATQVSEGETQ